MFVLEKDRVGGSGILKLTCVVRSETITGRWSLRCSKRTPDMVEAGGIEQKTWSMILLEVGVG